MRIEDEKFDSESDGSSITYPGTAMEQSLLAEQDEPEVVEEVRTVSVSSNLKVLCGEALPNWSVLKL